MIQQVRKFKFINFIILYVLCRSALSTVHFSVGTHSNNIYNYLKLHFELQAKFTNRTIMRRRSMWYVYLQISTNFVRANFTDARLESLLRLHLIILINRFSMVVLSYYQVPICIFSIFNSITISPPPFVTFILI